jgi:hypothetical protein
MTNFATELTAAARRDIYPGNGFTATATTHPD